MVTGDHFGPGGQWVHLTEHGVDDGHAESDDPGAANDVAVVDQGDDTVVGDHDVVVVGIVVDSLLRKRLQGQ